MKIIEGTVATINVDVKESYNSSSGTWRKTTKTFLSLDRTFACYKGGMKVQNGNKLIMLGKYKHYRGRHGFSIEAYYNLSQAYLSIDKSENPLLYVLAVVLLICAVLAGYWAFIDESRVIGFTLSCLMLSSFGIAFIIGAFQNRKNAKTLENYIKNISKRPNT